MTTSDGALIGKLAAIMATVKRLPKDERNPQGWTYTSVMDMLDLVRPEMAKAGIIMVPDIESVEYQDGQSARGTATVTCHMCVRWVVYGSDGASISFRTWGEALDTSDKATNKALTAAQKLAVSKLMMISTGEEEDTDSAHVERVATPGARPAPEDEGYGICADHGVAWKRFTDRKDPRKTWISHRPIEKDGQWHRRDDALREQAADDMAQGSKPMPSPAVAAKQAAATVPLPEPTPVVDQATGEVLANKPMPASMAVPPTEAAEFTELARKRGWGKPETVRWARGVREDLNKKNVKDWTADDYRDLTERLKAWADGDSEHTEV